MSLERKDSDYRQLTNLMNPENITLVMTPQIMIDYSEMFRYASAMKSYIDLPDSYISIKKHGPFGIALECQTDDISRLDVKRMADQIPAFWGTFVPISFHIKK